MDLSPAEPLLPRDKALCCEQRSEARRLIMRIAILRTKAALVGICTAIALAACAPAEPPAVAEQPSESPANRKHAVPSLIAERAAVTPGDVFLAALKLDLE